MKINKLSKIFKALGNERRLYILKHLLAKRELTVSQISELINLSFKSVSKHLLILENANLVKSKQIGLNKLYSINREGTKDIINIIS